MDNLSARLLFVAITRAAHKLNICWVGTISPLLDQQMDHVVVEPFMKDYQPELVNIEKYSEERHIEADGCIEQIARTGRLPLLAEGTFDPVLMDMIIRTINTTSESTTDDVLVVPLKPEEEAYLTALIQDWEGQENDEIQSALALIETIFGLYKNHMRNLALITAKDVDFSLVEQIISLVRLKKLLEDANLSLPTGRGAGRKRLLEEINPQRQKYHISILNTLIDYGLVELQVISDERSLIRISSEWNKAVLDFGLGYSPSGLDPDLVNNLPHLPLVVDLSKLVEVMHD